VNASQSEPVPPAPRLEFGDVWLAAYRALFVAALMLALLLLVDDGGPLSGRDVVHFLVRVGCNLILLGPYTWVELDARRMGRRPRRLALGAAFGITWLLAPLVTLETLYAASRLEGLSHAQAAAEILNFLQRSEFVGILLGVGAYVSLSLLTVTVARLGAWNSTLRSVLSAVTLPYYVAFSFTFWLADKLELVLGSAGSEREEALTKGLQVFGSDLSGLESLEGPGGVAGHGLGEGGRGLDEGVQLVADDPAQDPAQGPAESVEDAALDPERGLG